jgi:hypothetical protein
VVTQAGDVFEVGEGVGALCEKFALGDDAVAILVKDGEDFGDDLLGLGLVVVVRGGLLARLLVVQAVDGLELGDVEKAVAIQIVEVEEGDCAVYVSTLLTLQDREAA